MTLLAALVVLAGTAQAAPADVTLGTSSEPTTVAAGHGVVAWSTYDAGRYWLTASIAGTVSRLSVAPRGVPFDVDVGDVDGQPVITYSRCRAEPVARVRPPLPNWSDGHACRPWAYLPFSGRETRLATDVRWPQGASVALPAASGSSVGFAMQVRRYGHLPHLYRIGPDRRLRRLPENRLDTRGDQAAPVDVDIDATGHVASLWDGLYSKTCPPIVPRYVTGTVSEAHLMTAFSDRRVARTCESTGPLTFRGLTWDGTSASFVAISRKPSTLRRVSLTGRPLPAGQVPPATFDAATDGPATYAVVSHDDQYDIVAVGTESTATSVSTLRSGPQSLVWP